MKKIRLLNLYFDFSHQNADNRSIDIPLENTRQHMQKNPDYSCYYLAKQPIFDRNNNTYGYELLFRSESNQEMAVFSDGDIATMRVATAGFIRAQEDIDQSKRIFVNFTENLIREGAPRALPSSVTVVEILEDTIPLPEVTEEIIQLKQEGYFIAIDDFTDSLQQEKLLDLADIIKIDILGKSFKEIEDLYQCVANKKTLKVAEKVEDQATFEFAHKLGFDFFQGYFFAQPENLSGKTLESTQSSRLRILSFLNDPAIDIDTIISLVSIDPTITYRLLRLLNSAAFGLSMKIESIRHAVTLLGINRMRYWLRMIVLSDLTGDTKPKELFLLALSRGRFLEELAREENTITHPDHMFLFGILSLVDVMLEMPFARILPHLPLSDGFKAGYSDHLSPMGLYLNLAIALERGNIGNIMELCGQLDISHHHVSLASLRAGQWLQEIASSF